MPTELVFSLYVQLAPTLACGGGGWWPQITKSYDSTETLVHSTLYQGFGSGSGSGQTRIILPDLDPDRDWHPGHADPNNSKQIKKLIFFFFRKFETGHAVTKN